MDEKTRESYVIQTLECGKWHSAAVNSDLSIIRQMVAGMEDRGQTVQIIKRTITTTEEALP